MVRNAVATFSALWLFLAPALCAAGVLTHPCECSEGVEECGSCCASDEELGCDCVDEGCSHDGCDNDPCGATAAAEKGRTQPRVPVFEIAVLGLPDLLQKDRSAPGESLTASSGPPGLARNLPYPPSDIPLRV